MNMKKGEVCISVIIPIYGSEKYIERCVRSLFEQTMTKGIEFIFVNDCTPDNSISILKSVLEQYPSRKQQTFIIEQPTNHGPDYARKTGVAKACGRYVAFCDSDDWVELDTYQRMLEKAVAEDLDMVICNDYIMDKTGKDRPRHKRVFSGSDLAPKRIMSLQLSGILAGGVVQKLVKREYYEGGLLLPQSNIGEDLLLSVQIIDRCKKIGYLERPLYHYFYNAESLSHQPSRDVAIKRCYDYKKNIDLIIDYLKSEKKYEQCKYDLSPIKLRCRFILIPYINTCYNLWRSIYPELDTWEHFIHFPCAQKIEYIMIRLHLYKLLNILRSVYKKIK